MTEVITALLEKRKEKNMSQEEMAELLGISRQYYNAIENGIRKPSIDLAKKISETLGVEWTIFFA